MAIVSTNSKQALVEVATKVQIQVNQQGALLEEGESISVDVAGDGQSITINATFRGGMITDASGNPTFVTQAPDTPASFGL